MKVFLTGGSRGIGLTIKKLFESRGHYVYCPGRDTLDLSQDFKLDVIDFDIIVNNAGINPLKSVIEMDQEFVMKVNYLSPLKIIQHCLPYMIDKRFGRIVNIGSIWSHISKDNRSAYSASKVALESLSRSITSEYGKYNILANTVSPGFISTDLTRQNNTEDEIKELERNIPLSRLGASEEVAELVYYLTIENSYITGQNIIIDGGFSCVA